MSLKNIVLGIAIIILTMFVSIYGINTFYPSPEYEDFCPDYRSPVPQKFNESGEVCPTVCVEMYEIQNEQCVFNECGSGCGPDGMNSFETQGQCEAALAAGGNCYDAYDDARERYSRNVFILAIPLGIAIILLGAFFFHLEAVGVGLMGGGIGTLLYGVSRYWSYADNWLRFSLSLFGLVVLIYATYWFNEKNFLFMKKSSKSNSGSSKKSSGRKKNSRRK